VTSGLWRRAARFGASGLIVTALHTGYAVAAIELNGWPPPTANGVAFTFATLVSYLLNTRWSFAKPPCGRSFLRFWAVCGLGLLQSVGLSSLAQSQGHPYPVGIALILLTVPPVSFGLHSRWTYRDAPVPTPAGPARRRSIPGTPSRRNRRKRRHAK
jgi:putative flippase GtrA